MKKILFATLVLFITAPVFSQSKVGSIDVDYIISQMPELKQVSDSLSAYGKMLDEQLQAKINEYQEKLNAYNATAETLTEDVMREKQEEIFAIEDDITKFQQNGVTLMRLREDELKRPLYQKIGAALEKVAKENNYTQVLSMESGLVFIDPNYDLTLSVLQEMGIQTGN